MELVKTAEFLYDPAVSLNRVTKSGLELNSRFSIHGEYRKIYKTNIGVVMDGLKRILVVDDDRDIVDLISIYLEGEYELETFSNAKLALEAAKSKMIDLFIIDIYMPEMDGASLIQKLREEEQYKDTPILAISGYLSRDHYVEKAKNIGASDFIEKPIPLGTLLNSISRIFS